MKKVQEKNENKAAKHKKAVETARKVKEKAQEEAEIINKRAEAESREITQEEANRIDELKARVAQANAIINGLSDKEAEGAKEKADKKAARAGEPKKKNTSLFPDLDTNGEFVRETNIKLSIPRTIKAVKLYKDDRGTPHLFRLVLEREDDDDVTGTGESIEEAIKDFKKTYKKTV